MWCQWNSSMAAQVTIMCNICNIRQSGFLVITFEFVACSLKHLKWGLRPVRTLVYYIDRLCKGHKLLTSAAMPVTCNRVSNVVTDVQPLLSCWGMTTESRSTHNISCNTSCIKSAHARESSDPFICARMCNSTDITHLLTSLYCLISELCKTLTRKD